MNCRHASVVGRFQLHRANKMNAKNSCRRENSSIAEGLQNRFFTFPFFIVLNIIEFIYSIMCHLISWKKRLFLAMQTAYATRSLLTRLQSEQWILTLQCNTKKNRMWSIKTDLCRIVRRERCECLVQRAVGIYRLIISRFLSISIPIKWRNEWEPVF